MKDSRVSMVCISFCVKIKISFIILNRGAKDYGAQVVLHGEVFDDAAELAAQLSQEQGLTYVHPFNDLTLASMLPPDSTETTFLPS